MPVQTQMSSFAKKMGARVAQANAEHKDKPVDVGIQALPPGIKNGIAKLIACYTGEYKQGANKGQPYFRAAGVIKSPTVFAGQTLEGRQTSVMIPLCDVAVRGMSKAVSFNENWFEFQNWFKQMGIGAPNETPQSDPTGQKIEAYYFVAMKTLLAKGPHFGFSTRGWTPPATPQKPNPTEMIFELWHGLAEFNGQHDPAGAVTETMPPTQTTAPTNHTPPTQTATAVDPADEVAALVETAMSDPEGATPDGAEATTKLERMAWAAGATKEQTAGAKDWGEVGEMALGIFPSADSTAPTTTPTTAPVAGMPGIGSKWKFAKRTKEGTKLKNAKGEEFPAFEVEVIAVDNANKTCTLKSLKDGKEVTDIRTKKAIAAKFEWLE